jgi:hypothetical protein
LAGGKPKEGSGFFYEATLIADLKQDDELTRVSQFDQCGSCELWGVCDVIGVSP